MINILFNAKTAEKHPIEMMFVGIFYSSLSILLSVWIFPDQSSIVMVFFTVFSCIYVIQKAMRIEENIDRKDKNEKWILMHHSKILFSLLFLFIGFVISFSFWTLVLPNEMVHKFFTIQESVVTDIRSNITGNAISKNGFLKIMTNNTKVLLVSWIFAFFYGAGAIFILVWNASVMGFVIGNLAKESLGLIAIPIAFLKYFLHGIPEMLAYLTAALAGGIMYVAFLKGDFLKVERRRKIIFDILILALIAIFLLIIAALIEVYISPII